MTRAQWALVALIAAELAAGTFVLARPRTRAVPPAADLSFVDPLLADHFRSRAAACDTADDWATLGEEFTAYGYFPEGEACCRIAAGREPDNPV